MAALAALRVAASATQLVAYSKSIISFIATAYDRVKDAPQQYRSFELQLKLLVDITNRIEQNPILQTAGVKCHLESTLVETRALQSILCCPSKGLGNGAIVWRYWNLFKGTEQQEILVYLESFHRKNTGLILSINTVNTTQLARMEASVEQLVHREDRNGCHDFLELLNRSVIQLYSSRIFS